MPEDLGSIIDRSPLFAAVFKHAEINAIQVMDKDGYILAVNKAFTNLFGYTTEDLAGKHSRVLFTEEDRKAKMPEIEIETVRERLSTPDKNYIVHKDGTCVWVSGESVLAKGIEGETLILKFIQSIHEQKVMEKFLREATEFSESVVSSITDALVVFDTGYKIFKANNAFYNLFNIQTETVEGQPLFQIPNNFFQSPELRQQLSQVPEKQSSVNFQLEWKEDGATIKHINAKAILLDGKNVNTKIMLVMTDITDKVSSEQQKDDVIAFVVHEVRNPLNNLTLINTLLEDALTEDDKAAANEYISKSKTSIANLNLLIQELYDATKAGSGNLRISRETFNFEGLLNEVIEAVELSNPGFTIKKEGSGAVTVQADRRRIGQVLTNYILNAVKYSAGSSKVDIQLSVDGGNVVVAVQDYGRGIAEEQIPHVFDRYFRAENTKKVEGLGLGLFLCKQIIDGHNGRVWMKSKVNEGSTFYFSIPVA